MPLFRRREPGPELRAFRVVATHVEAAQRALLAAVPTARDPGVPLPEAIASFDEHLVAARAAMSAWTPRNHEWTKCDEALRNAADEGRSLAGAGSMGFEALNARIGDVLHPLETFADVERALRRR